jgi:hypothetical protein
MHRRQTVVVSMGARIRKSYHNTEDKSIRSIEIQFYNNCGVAISQTVVQTIICLSLTSTWKEHSHQKLARNNDIRASIIFIIYYQGNRIMESLS